MSGADDASKLDQQVAEFVCGFFRLPPGEVTTSSRLVYDLGADSSDVLDLVIQLSEHFGCQLDPQRLATVVQVADLCTAIQAALAATSATD